MQSFHMGINVRGCLKWPVKDFKRLVKGMKFSDGRVMTPDQARDALLDELSKGHEVIPFGPPCDAWDYKTGCQGHEQTTSPAPDPPSPRSGQVAPSTQNSTQP